MGRGGGGQGVRKMNISGGIKTLWIFLGSSQNWAIFYFLIIISMHFRVLS